jgi:hypothetical protein
MGVALLVEPSQHWLEYSSCVMKKIADQFRNRLRIVELQGSDANPSRIDSVLSAEDPVLLWGVGHGNVDIWTVECMQTYMRVCDSRTSRMSGRVVHLNSCLTANQLGPDLIQKGALAYYGHKTEFYLLADEGPCANKAMTTVFDAEHTVEKSLFSGKTTGEAQRDRMKAYDDEIKYWTDGPGKGDPHAEDALYCLNIDKSGAVFLGREDVRIVGAAAAVPFWVYVSAGAAFAASALLAYAASRPKARVVA